VWGTLRADGTELRIQRFIPTCVGNSANVSGYRTEKTVHPHVCGELHRSSQITRPSCGSSPRVWGTLRRGISVFLIIRFIPTCVGNSRLPGGLLPVEPVHPHVCGELSPIPPENGGMTGSSPRVWGTLSALTEDEAYQRFIPTCVGNSDDDSLAVFHRPVHPHVCGELVRAVTFLEISTGSSPRVWGTRLKLEDPFFQVRFIPTCVGNSIPDDFVLYSLAVHPHVCGELRKGCSIIVYFYGSSPRVWGTPPSCVRPTAITRFIPTCVGNSETIRQQMMLFSVHPHVCGELRIFPDHRLLDAGSSPRVWGTLHRCRHSRDMCRFIPTCVGNSYE